MRVGEIVEDRATADLFTMPQHPYTRELLSAIPLPEPEKNWLNA
jgi:ABC-type oligopeptide transport system ATPase subunit